MALSEIYVDPSIAADSGTGTIGDPFGDLEYAIEQTTFDTTNGTRVNIKSGTDEVLAADLSNALADTVTTVAWVPSGTAPCVFQGYTSVAGDGGIGGISGGGSVGIFINSAQDYIYFYDLHLHNTGAISIIDLDDYCGILGCELDTSTAGTAILADNYLDFTDNYVHDCAIGLQTVFGTNVTGNFFENNTSDISMTYHCYVARNIINTSGSGTAISCRYGNPIIENNSIYSAAGTGTGIRVVTGSEGAIVRGNLVEGYSGVGGIGIRYDEPDLFISALGGNAVYDCTTAYASGADLIAKDLGDNETLTASPFTDAANGDFSPVDTGNVKEGSLPNTIGNG